MRSRLCADISLYYPYDTIGFRAREVAGDDRNTDGVCLSWFLFNASYFRVCGGEDLYNSLAALFGIVAFDNGADA